MKGFTLIEILLALGILALISLAVVFLPLGFKKNVDLDGQSEQIVNILSIGQSNARNRLDNADWGVHLERGRYSLFRGSSYNPADHFNRDFYLPSGLEISSINLNGGGPDVIFGQFSGETADFGDFRVNLISDPSAYREIQIGLSGQSQVAGSALPALGTRIADSRHVHYQLGWSIRDSAKITFFFPRVSQTEKVMMADYFNVDKSDFDWSGDFTVGGRIQELRIHTHSLSPTDTLLSVTRDRSSDKNNEELEVYIDYGGANREIAHYLAGGSVSAGDYGGAMSLQ